MRTVRTQISPPNLVRRKRKRGVGVGTQEFWLTLSGNGVVGHEAKCSVIDVAGFDAETDDPPGELIHNDPNQAGKWTPPA